MINNMIKRYEFVIEVEKEITRVSEHPSGPWVTYKDYEKETKELLEANIGLQKALKASAEWQAKYNLEREQLLTDKKELIDMLERLAADAPINPWSYPECSSDFIENERYRVAELIKPLIDKHKE